MDFVSERMIGLTTSFFLNDYFTNIDDADYSAMLTIVTGSE